MAKERTVVSKVTNGVLYSDGSIRVDNVRWSYPHLGTPYKTTGDDGKEKESFEVTGMLPKSTHGAVKELLKKAINDLMLANDVKVGSGFWCLKDGDKIVEEEDGNPEYAGHWILKSSERRRPAVRRRNGEVMTPAQADDEVYGGCWGDMLIRPWYFDGKAKNGKTYPKRILANLIGARFVRDDEPFGEGRVSDDGVWDDSDDGMGEEDDL